MLVFLTVKLSKTQLLGDVYPDAPHGHRGAMLS